MYDLIPVVLILNAFVLFVHSIQEVTMRKTEGAKGRHNKDICVRCNEGDVGVWYVV